MESNEVIAKKSIFQKLLLFFVKPAELFRDYIEKPTWALKLLIISLITALFAYESKILGKDILAEMLEEKAASMPPEQAEAVRASIGFINSPAMNIVSAAAAVLSVLAVILILSLVYMAFIRVMKGKIKYRQALSVYTLAYMAAAIGLLVKLAYMYFSGNLIYLDMDPTYTDALYNSLDPFTIWQSILMLFGISTVSGITEKKSAMIVVVMWLASLLFSLGSILLAK